MFLEATLLSCPHALRQMSYLLPCAAASPARLLFLSESLHSPVEFFKALPLSVAHLDPHPIQSVPPLLCRLKGLFAGFSFQGPLLLSQELFAFGLGVLATEGGFFTLEGPQH